MKNTFNYLLISSIFLLVSCNVNQPSITSNDVTSSTIPSTNSVSGDSSSTISNIPSTTNSISTDTPTTFKDIKYDFNPTGEPDFNKQLGIFNPLGNMMNVWEHYRGDGVKVAIIDSGFDINHPEFTNAKNKISSDSAYIYTSNGTIYTKKGIEHVNITDGDSHGTMCAGILGALSNDKGITGMAPNAELMFIKIDKKHTSYAEAFKYAADNGARIISTSLGAYPNSNGETFGDVHFPAGTDLSTVFQSNINYAHNKGVVIVAASGNNLSTALTYPAGNDNVIGVGGLNYGSLTNIWNENNGEGSNYNGSKQYVDIFAPSNGIYAPGFDVSNNRSTYWSNGKGTSFSAPLVAGALALYFQKYPDHTNIQTIDALKNSATNINSYNDKNMGWGRLNVEKLLNISEDIEINPIVSSTTISQDVTTLNIIDEEGWDFRTLHLYDVKFASNYSYYELENYFDSMYNNRVATANYYKEGTTMCWAYTDENFIGDYYLCLGNKDHAVATTYQYIFPWWVEGFKYQIVNNNHWYPENGNEVTKNLVTYNSYFWFDSDTSFGVSQVQENKTNSYSFPAVNIKEISSSKEDSYVTSVFDFYYPKNISAQYYLDSSHNIRYIIDVFKKDTILYY